jgi:predicted amidohydrolase YtcJ
VRHRIESGLLAVIAMMTAQGGYKTVVAKTRERNQTDLILVNGRVFTADPSQPYAEAVAIRGERVLAVGTSDEIAALADANTRRIDLQGHVAIPGINDAHYHFPSTPLGEHRLSFQSMEPSWQETQDALAEAVKQVPAGTWIFGVVGGTVVGEPEANRFALDRVAPDHPVYLMTYYGHGDIVNTKAMHALEVAEEEPDPMGGHFERVPGSKRINGRIFEYAQWSLWRGMASRIPDAELIKGMQALADEAVRYGVTTIQDMPFISPDRCVKLLQGAQVPIRVRVIRMSMTSVEGRDLAEGRDLPLRPFGQPTITVRGTKWILDGTPFEWGAALRGTYLDRPDWSGRLNFAETEIASMVRESLQWEDQLLLHCAGDKPIEALFEAMEEAQDVDWTEKRVRIEHGDALVGDLIPRARRLGVVVVQNPTHLSLVDLMRERYGLDTPFFPLRSLLEAGIPLAIGSDGPLNPYLNIMFAVLHPVHPAEALTLEEAVEAYTRGAAFAEFEEGEKGTISEGKLADIAVLSQDIFTMPVDALPTTESILTLVGGKVVYDAQALY